LNPENLATLTGDALAKLNTAKTAPKHKQAMLRSRRGEDLPRDEDREAVTGQERETESARTPGVARGRKTEKERQKE